MPLGVSPIWLLLSKHDHDCALGALLRCAARGGVESSLVPSVLFHQGADQDLVKVMSDERLKFILMSARNLAADKKVMLRSTAQMLMPSLTTPDCSARIIQSLPRLFEMTRRSHHNHRSVSLLIVLVSQLIHLCERAVLGGPLLVRNIVSCYEIELHKTASQQCNQNNFMAYSLCFIAFSSFMYFTMNIS